MTSYHQMESSLQGHSENFPSNMSPSTSTGSSYADCLHVVQSYSAVIAIVILYSFVINCLFGHRTYWRSSANMKNILSKLLHSFSPSYWFGSSFLRPRRIIPIRMDLLREDIALEIVSYLSPAEVIQLMQTSNSLNKLCCRNFVWDRMMKNSMSLLTNLHHPIQLPPISLSLCPLPPYQAFFILWRHIVSRVAESYNDVCVIISGSVYDLTCFLDKHPGGAAILIECRGRDGTFEFNVSNHSWDALQSAKRYLILAHEDIFGCKGLPSFAKKYLKQNKGQNLIPPIKTVP